MVGTSVELTRVPFSDFYAQVTKAVEPVVAYVMKLPIPMFSKKRLVLIVRAYYYSSTRGRAK